MIRKVAAIIMEYFFELYDLLEFVDKTEAEAYVYYLSIFFMILPMDNFSQKYCIGKLNVSLKVIVHITNVRTLLDVL